MKKFREILAEVFDGLTTLQNTPNFAFRQVEKFLNHPRAIKDTLFSENRIYTLNPVCR